MLKEGEEIMEKHEKNGLISILVGMWVILLFTRAEVAFYFKAHLGLHPQIVVPLVITGSAVLMFFGYIQFSGKK